MPFGINAIYRVPTSPTKENNQIKSPTSLLDLSTDSSDSSVEQSQFLKPLKMNMTMASPPIESDDEFSDDEVEAAMYDSESAVPAEIDMDAFLSLGLINDNKGATDKNEDENSTPITANGSIRRMKQTEIESPLRIGINRPTYAPSACFDYSPVVESRLVESKNVTPTSNSAAAAAASTGGKSQDFQRPLGLYQDIPQYHQRQYSPKNLSISAALSSPSQKSLYADLEKAAGTIHSDLSSAHDNGRFVTPGQVFEKKLRSLPHKYTPERGSGLGITPPPTRNKSSRLIVPYVTPPSNDTYTIFILVIQPTAKLFELIRVNYHPATATIGYLMDLISEHVSEEALRDQKHIGFCRPSGSSSFSRNLTNMNMTASVMARDGTCARIFCGEVLVAIPEGYTGKEVQVLSQHILQLPKMQKLINKPDPLSESKRRKARNTIDDNDSVSLGIQPMSKSDNTAETFSSSILFGPPGTIQEEVNVNDKNQKSPLRNDILSLLPIATNTISSPPAAEPGHTTPRRKNESALVVREVSTLDLDAIKREAALAARIAAKEAYTAKMHELLTNFDIPLDERTRLIEDCDDLSLNSDFEGGSKWFDSDSRAYPTDINLNGILTENPMAADYGGGSSRAYPSDINHNGILSENPMTGSTKIEI